MTKTFNASLLPYNTFGMDVKAAIFAEYETLAELQTLLADEDIRTLIEQQKAQGELPFWHIGAGSNLLFKGDYPGVVRHCKSRGIRLLDGEGRIEVQSGTTWDDVCQWCCDHALYGAENLSLIPGEAGAGAVQNIGAYGVEIKDLIEEVVCWDVQEQCIRRLSKDDMQYGYRASLLKQPAAKSLYIVTSVILKLQTTPAVHLEYAGLKQALADLPQPTAQDVRNAVIAIRQGKLPDPKVLGNAGSFFMNPIVSKETFEQLLNKYPQMPHYHVDDENEKIPAGWLIDQSGWKGKTLGKAGVHDKQALVLVNKGGATGNDIVALCNAVREDVKSKFGVDIHPEVNFV